MKPVTENGPLLDWNWSRAVSGAVRSRRASLRVPLASLAGETGIPLAQLCSTEAGNHRWRAAHAERTAAALGTDLAGLLAGDPS